MSLRKPKLPIEEEEEGFCAVSDQLNSPIE
jgi:hypothetical protein